MPGCSRLADIYSSRDPDGGYTDNSAEAILAISCLDDPFADHAAAGSPAELPAFQRGLADVRRRLRLGPGRLPRPGRRVDRGAAHDRRLRRGADRGRRHHPRPGDAVRVGARRSPTSSTPAVLVSRDGDGHTGYNVGNDCVDGAVEDYLLDGTVPDDGLTC